MYLQGSLGNLLALSRGKNAAMQNESFPDKVKKTYSDGKTWGYFNGSYSEIEIAQERDWTPELIYKRGIKMLEFMEMRWIIQINNQIKKDLLFLDFIK